MTDKVDAKGSCLCGKVEIEVRGMTLELGACHCENCQRWCGGPLLTVDCGNNVSYNGEGSINFYKSSGWGERASCKHCGSLLFFRKAENQHHYVVAGVFGKAYDFVFDHQIFIDRKPDYYCFSNKTQDMTADEFYRMVGAEN